MLIKITLLFVFISFCCSIANCFSQQNLIKKYALHGHIRSNSGEPLAGVALTIKELHLSISTNSEGYYSFSLPAGKYKIEATYLGFTTLEQQVSIDNRTSLDFKLQESYHETAEIVVKANRSRNLVKSMDMGTQRLEMKTLKKLPALFGEVDIIRSVLTLPGVSTVGEGATGFNVRGGGVDQNLVLMDREPLFNSSHLFGFFSVYNPDAVQDATLIKGGIPAEYAGRLSSILDVRLKDGDPDKINGSGGLGTVSSRLALGGPIQKGSSTFFVSARRSYADLFLKLSHNPVTRKSYAYFYDLNAKASFNMGNNDKLEMSSYYGQDVANFNGQFGFTYGNALGSLNWKHRFSPRFQVDGTTGVSNFTNSLGIPSGTNGFTYLTNILNSQVKTDFNWDIDKSNQVKFGASINRYDIEPGKVQPQGSTSFFNTLSTPLQRAYEYGLYAQHQLNISKALSVQYGLHMSVFDYVAAARDSIFSYAGALGQTKTALNGRLYAKGSSIKTYAALEPRISVRYLLNDESSIKASYNRTAQYIHLISNTNAASPFDIWASTSNNIQPEKADQVSIGYFQNLYKQAFETSVELYYKKLYNQIDYVNGAQTLLNKNLEGELLYGNARSYGAEFYMKKNTGRLQGYLSYTLSKTERKIPGINDGNYYPAKYDRTHNLSTVATYEYSARWSFSADFTYQTGVSTTFANSRYIFQGIVIPYNTQNSRNNYRLPSYNRLDLAATLYGRKHEHSRYQSNWVFSIYNVYRRKNAYSIYFQTDKNNPNITQAERLSIIGTAIPAVTWNVEF